MDDVENYWKRAGLSEGFPVISIDTNTTVFYTINDSGERRKRLCRQVLQGFSRTKRWRAHFQRPNK